MQYIKFRYNNSMLIDSHAHLYFPGLLEDFEGVLKRAIGAGVNYIINIGTDIETSQKALAQAKQALENNIQIYSTIGIHPHDVIDSLTNTSIQEFINQLEQLYLNNKEKIIAVGECGLDFSTSPQDDTKNIQIKLFKAQIDLAKKLNLPLIIHCRDAWDEMLNHLCFTSDVVHNGVFHCYSGDLEITKRVLNTPLFISFAGNITYPKNEGLRESAKIIPLDRILLETDSPFLAPQKYRGKTNEPSFVTEVAKCLSEIKNISLEELVNQTNQNSMKLFNIN